MATLGTAYVNIRGNSKKLKSDLDKSRKTVQTAAGKMQAAIDSINWNALGVAGTAMAGAFVVAAKKSIDAASDLEEVTSKFGVVFGDQIKVAEKWSKALVDSYAMSTREAKQYLSSVQDLLVPMGMQANSAAALSNEIVKLSADLGSFNNTPTARVMDDIQSALVGNYETMKKYGVVLNVATVEQQAFNMGLATSKADLTTAEKAHAAYALMVAGSSAALGDMARTSGSYANQTKKLHANVEDLSVILGNELLPVATDVVSTMNHWIDANRGLIQQDITTYVEATARAMERIWKIVSYDPDVLQYGLVGFVLAGRKGAVVIGGMAHMVNWAQNLAGAFDNAKKGLVDFSEIATANFKQLEELAQRSSIFTGLIGANTEGFDSVYKPGEIPEPISITPGVGSDSPGGGVAMDNPFGDSSAWEAQAAERYEVLSRQYEYELDLKAETLTAAAAMETDMWLFQAAGSKDALRRYQADEETKRKLQKFIAKDMLNNSSFFFAEMGKQSDTAFRIFQGIEIARAVINTAQATVTAFKQGWEAGGPYAAPIVAAAYAASAAAGGAAQIAAISSASPGSSGSPAATTSISAMPVSISRPDTSTSTGISLDKYDQPEERGKLEINISEFIGDESYIDYLIEKINEAQEDRDVTVNYG